MKKVGKSHVLTVLTFLVCFLANQVNAGWLTLNGIEYYYSEDYQNYTNAKTVCSSMDTYLVSMNDDAENDILAKSAGGGYYWISIGCVSSSVCDVDDLRWADGSRITYTDGFQALLAINANTAYGMWTPVGSWASVPIDQIERYICEKQADFCASSPCQNDGTCEMDSNGAQVYSCQCPLDVDGLHCQNKIALPTTGTGSSFSN